MTPRFCILRHDHPFLHWDFLIEKNDHAQCWRLLSQPVCGVPIPAEPLPPHRLLYLEYEGPVSNNRGAVIRIAEGTYQVISEFPQFMIRLEGLVWAQFAFLDNESPKQVFWQFSRTSDRLRKH
ncbi:MAG: DNA polymerase ligase N-terminal domain-containing protein [Planctomycetaceae bacterium]